VQKKQELKRWGLKIKMISLQSQDGERNYFQFRILKSKVKTNKGFNGALGLAGCENNSGFNGALGLADCENNSGFNGALVLADCENNSGFNGALVGASCGGDNSGFNGALGLADCRGDNSGFNGALVGASCGGDNSGFNGALGLADCRGDNSGFNGALVGAGCEGYNSADQIGALYSFCRSMKSRTVAEAMPTFTRWGLIPKKLREKRFPSINLGLFTYTREVNGGYIGGISLFNYINNTYDGQYLATGLLNIVKDADGKYHFTPLVSANMKIGTRQTQPSKLETGAQQ
jgi:hypothetical protein